MSHPRPVSPDALPELLAEAILERAPARVAIDGAPPAGAEAVAGAVAGRLRLLGRPVIVVSTRWFLRAASLRWERGRTNPDALYEDWLDAAALRREVLDPAGPGGSRRILDRLRDPDTDRAVRAPYRGVEDREVIVVAGSLLLGRGLPFDLTIHMRLSRGALERRTPEAERWTLPAYARYAAEVAPDRHADIVVRADDPRHLAVAGC